MHETSWKARNCLRISPLQNRTVEMIKRLLRLSDALPDNIIEDANRVLMTIPIIGITEANELVRQSHCNSRSVRV